MSGCSSSPSFVFQVIGCVFLGVRFIISFFRQLVAARSALLGPLRLSSFRVALLASSACTGGARLICFRRELPPPSLSDRAPLLPLVWTCAVHPGCRASPLPPCPAPDSSTGRLPSVTHLRGLSPAFATEHRYVSLCGVFSSKFAGRDYPVRNAWHGAFSSGVVAPFGSLHLLRSCAFSLL